MKKLELNEMNSEQLQKVFGNNELFGEVSDDMAESEMDFISDQLEKLRPYMLGWSIGQCNRNQHIDIDILYSKEFVQEVFEINKKEVMLGYTSGPYLQEALEMINELENTDVVEEEEKFEILEKKVDTAAQTLADTLCENYTSVLDERCLDKDVALNHFVYFYADERMDGDEYVLLDDNGGSDWKLHKDVSYTKTWG